MEPKLMEIARRIRGLREMLDITAEDMAGAVRIAAEKAQPGDIVSLSPASASFDLYPIFEVRGRDYKRIVNELQ